MSGSRDAGTLSGTAVNPKSTGMDNAPRTWLPRYGDCAILLHWTMAVLIVGLLAFGKYTHTLDPTSALYVSFIQLHKSFGIIVLLLAVFRLLWRLAHSPPALPATDPLWQRFAAGATHVLIYLLMLGIPLTGWVMVSASPLNVDTVLFGLVPWPHLPPFPTLDDRESVAALFHTLHELGGNILIGLLILHIAAALKHHLIDKDHVLRRMLPDWANSIWRARLMTVCMAVAALVSGMVLYANASRSAALVAAGNAEVSFVATVTGNEIPGMFSDASVTATLDETDPAKSLIEARVVTASVTSSDSNVETSIKNDDWFAIERFDEAVFVSDAVRAGPDPSSLSVDGTLTIRDKSLAVSFPMSIENTGTDRFAAGEFTVDRRSFDLGIESQPDDGWVGYDVIIRFRFPISDGG